MGFAIGLFVLNVALFYMLGSTKWSSISKKMSMFHEQVHEISIRKNLYHQQISRSVYTPHALMNQQQMMEED